jgi:Putative transposase
LLFHASSQALQQLALDPRFVGACLGMVGVLHAWIRQLLYHPHVHYIVTGGGLTNEGHWRSARKDFLLPVKALSLIFRAKFRDALKKSALFALVNPRVWFHHWVVHAEPVGSGEQAFQYLAPYIFRVALSNNRIRSLQQGAVTFAYKEWPLTNSSLAPSPPKSSFVASSNTSSHHASSRSVTTACSAPPSGNCYRLPDNCSPLPPAN